MNATYVIHTHLSRMSLQPRKLLGGILWVLLVTLSTSCQSDQTRQADLTLDDQMSKSSTLTFPLDNDTSPTVWFSKNTPTGEVLFAKQNQSESLSCYKLKLIPNCSRYFIPKTPKRCSNIPFY